MNIAAAMASSHTDTASTCASGNTRRSAANPRQTSAMNIRFQPFMRARYQLPPTPADAHSAGMWRRFVGYGIAGWGLEVAFTSVTDTFRRMRGHTYAWM